MKLWMKRISVFLITFMTLGLYTPPIDLNSDLEHKQIVTAKESAGAEIAAPANDAADEIDFTTDRETNDSDDYIVQALTEQVKEHTVTKLGPRIANKVEPEFTATILPNMQTVVQMILADAGENAINYYGITELPTQGYGERIFNIHDHRTEKDVARFDVRRENRPGEGYWFNFHYHLSDDEFAEHHSIGEIYWDKNMPPKWMA